jgi:hypothetical protein
VQSLLYRFAQWHALAKLRIQSDSTLTFLDETFKKLSQKLRRFQRDTCAAFNAKELPKEKTARQRRDTQRSEPNTIPTESSQPRVKKFNLGTYKFHAMGDYVRSIRFFGTTDSFTTQIVSTSRILLLLFIKVQIRAGGACTQSCQGILSANQQIRYPSSVSEARA